MKTIKHVSYLNILLKDKNFFDKMFKDVNTFAEVVKRIDRSTEESYTTLGFKDKYEFIGDLFEIFAEMFFIINAADNRVGITNYIPTPKSTDHGVDGFGIGINGKTATVQVKFRSDRTKELLERDIKQFGYTSIVGYSVDKDTTTNMIIFTSGKGLHWFTGSKMFENHMRVINYEMISKLIDNNYGFWNSCSELLAESYKSYFKV
jgi:hypothetical protein